MSSHRLFVDFWRFLTDVRSILIRKLLTSLHNFFGMGIVYSFVIFSAFVRSVGVKTHVSDFGPPSGLGGFVKRKDLRSKLGPWGSGLRALGFWASGLWAGCLGPMDIRLWAPVACAL